jgi:hypothetical protein
MSQPYYPIGHYHSPIPSAKDIENYFSMQAKDNALLGIDLNLERQLELQEEIDSIADQYPWKAEKSEGFAFYYNNVAFGHSCSFELYSFLRIYQPKRIIEIGSGFSTAAMYDVNMLFLNNTVEIICIEPYPHRIFECLNNNCVTLYQCGLQDISLNTFDVLNCGDILFIDSTHVSKLNSDVNRILFEIFPRLSKGVIIHIHDVIFPFTYPDTWIRENWAWNEAYILRAFLQFNASFKILYWSSCLRTLGRQPSISSGTIWLEKVA